MHSSRPPTWCDQGKRYRPDVLWDYLPLFNQLQHLSLSNIRFTSSEQGEIFSAFRRTLSRLTLDYCIVAFSRSSLSSTISPASTASISILLCHPHTSTSPPLFLVQSQNFTSQVVKATTLISALYLIDCQNLGRYPTRSSSRAGNTFPFSSSSTFYIP